MENLNLDENKFVNKKNLLSKKEKVLRHACSDPKYARNGRNEESSRTTS